MRSLIRQIRQTYSGVSWRNPLIRVGLFLLDPFDYLVRLTSGDSHLPPYSNRVRSNGIHGQFGGNRFSAEGELLTSLLQAHAGLDESSDVLEIGCGCGRVAIPLTRLLSTGNYTGLDIDPPSIRACRRNEILTASGFEFLHLDVYNRLYNPNGRIQDAQYEFPFDKETFDIVFLISVFTHMLPDGVANYVHQIGRVLRNKGRCFLSTFLMDYGHAGKTLSFPLELGDHRVYQKELPEKAVGYDLDFFRASFADQGLSLDAEPLIGTWRAEGIGPKAATPFPQDILVFTKGG